MEKNFRTMVERSIQGIIIIQNFCIVYANQALARICGFSKKELLSLSPSQVKR
jgi:PAS domain S-box-containing protein